MPDELIPIPRQFLPEIRNLFEPDWPKNHVGFYLVSNYIVWFQKKPDLPNVEFYSLNGDWSDGTFVVVDRYQLFLYSLEESLEKLKKILRLLDWSRGFKVSSFLKRHRPAVVEVVKEKNLSLEYDSETFLYFIPREKAKNLDTSPSPGIILKPMSTWEHAKKANDVWPNRHQGSLFFLKRLIDLSPNVGAFDSETDELLAWCFQLQAGPLGALQVDERHKRRGLGTSVAKWMAKHNADRDMDTFALVNPGNVASKAMLEKIGFEHLDEAYWLRTYPTVPFEWKD